MTILASGANQRPLEFAS